MENFFFFDKIRIFESTSKNPFTLRFRIFIKSLFVLKSYFCGYWKIVFKHCLKHTFLMHYLELYPFRKQPFLDLQIWWWFFKPLISRGSVGESDPPNFTENFASAVKHLWAAIGLWRLHNTWVCSGFSSLFEVEIFPSFCLWGQTQEKTWTHWSAELQSCCKHIHIPMMAS